MADLAPDPVVGDDLPGFGPAETAVSLLAPVHVYPLFENVLAARAGRDAARPTAPRSASSWRPFTEVAAGHPFAWFPEVRTADEIATPTPDNRIVCEPYTKRMTAFLGSDQAAALVVCSLAEARRAGVDDRAVFVWSGAEAVDVRFVSSRPDPGRSPAIAAAGEALFVAASKAAGRSVGIDDLESHGPLLVLPLGRADGHRGAGHRHRRPRGLTVTGGLPYFGGPGNNYTTHGIATLTDQLRDGAGTGTRLGLATGLGWFVTKHALGLYGSDPAAGRVPPGGHRRRPGRHRRIGGRRGREARRPRGGNRGGGHRLARQRRLRLPAPRSSPAWPTAARWRWRRPTTQVVAAMGDTDMPGLIGATVVVQAGEPRYRLAER